MNRNLFRPLALSFGVLLIAVGFWSQTIAAQNWALPVPGGPAVFLRFLESFQEENTDTADAYYRAVDPYNRRDTMIKWWVHNGFLASATTPWKGAGGTLPSEVPGGPALPAGDENIQVDVNSSTGGSSRATFVNDADLGFGRRHYLRTNAGGALASCVENYGTNPDELPNLDPNVPPTSPLFQGPRFYDVPRGSVEQQNILDVVGSRNQRGLVATVCMEYVAPDDDPTGKKRVTFYVFAANGTRVGSGIDLDGRGGKDNPGVCVVCHGGKPQKVTYNALGEAVYPNKGDTGAFFLPWDLETFVFDDTDGFRREDQEKNLRELNRAVLKHHSQAANFDEVSGLTRQVAPVELIKGWYGGAGLPNPTFDGEFVPKGWRNSTPGVPDGAPSVYREVIGPTCRACHAQRESALDFATFKGFKAFRDEVKNLTFTEAYRLSHGPIDDSPARPGDDRAVMPAALRTYVNFWNSTEPTQLFNFLRSLP